MIKLTCQCCKFEQEFTNSEDAFRKGWDAPPHFTGYVSCNLCPISFLWGTDHSSIHKEWNKNGRPEEFSEETCTVPKERTGLTTEEVIVFVDNALGIRREYDA